MSAEIGQLEKSGQLSRLAQYTILDWWEKTYHLHNKNLFNGKQYTKELYVLDNKGASVLEYKSLYEKAHQEYQRHLDTPNVYYVNTYTCLRRYGGPEEGGWYYDHRTPLESIPVVSMRNAIIQKEKTEIEIQKWNAGEEGPYPSHLDISKNRFYALTRLLSDKSYVVTCIEHDFAEETVPEGYK